MDGAETDLALDEAELSRIREEFSRNRVSFAMVFGSVARGGTRPNSDLDLAVSFEDLDPEDEGYSDAYLRLRSAIADAVPFDVDIVDVRTMPETFAESAFDHGVTVLGSEAERAELESELTEGSLSTEAAKDRVTAAVERLRRDAGADSRTV
ncbi:nucleotidyltransferase domain-containing protein [Halosimplex rubrum]|uniref:Nucleotidyltransferase domain-containing protein n=1 Tax=Halosimplex rubrum TaxID=869889 RepID=A0A7D5SWS8_9EURY|nr:nucleotidyltransferase domain-containing protein [Halosimplex rubrum]QLH76811.1 nucleotidyltransferase domain-containing protein [Halosimplex rubrum]